jgi:hypothetical protein
MGRKWLERNGSRNDSEVIQQHRTIVGGAGFGAVKVVGSDLRNASIVHQPTNQHLGGDSEISSFVNQLMLWSQVTT